MTPEKLNVIIYLTVIVPIISSDRGTSIKIHPGIAVENSDVNVTCSYGSVDNEMKFAFVEDGDTGYAFSPPDEILESQFLKTYILNSVSLEKTNNFSCLVQIPTQSGSQYYNSTAGLVVLPAESPPVGVVKNANIDCLLGLPPKVKVLLRSDSSIKGTLDDRYFANCHLILASGEYATYYKRSFFVLVQDEEDKKVEIHGNELDHLKIMWYEDGEEVDGFTEDMVGGILSTDVTTSNEMTDLVLTVYSVKHHSTIVWNGTIFNEDVKPDSSRVDSGPALGSDTSKIIIAVITLTAFVV